MFRVLRHLLLLLLLAGCVRAATLEEANAHFAAGDYAKAAAAGDQIIATEGPSATVLYNLGNARFKLKEYGPAILAYERAALLSPRDPDIRANLKLARSAAAAFADSGPDTWWPGAAQWFSLHEWSWITAGGAALLAATALLWGIAGLSRPCLKRIAIAGIVLGVLSGSLGGAALWLRRGEKTLGIITVAAATLRLSPFPAANPAGTPGPGRTVHLGERTNGWVYITIPGASQSGWLPESEVTAIMP